MQSEEASAAGPSGGGMGQGAPATMSRAGMRTYADVC